jgi:hypothetical protein
MWASSEAEKLTLVGGFDSMKVTEWLLGKCEGVERGSVLNAEIWGVGH